MAGSPGASFKALMKNRQRSDDHGGFSQWFHGFMGLV
jgi:hypothetical protein